MQTDQSEISWRDGDVPVSERFGDPFYSLEDGLAETMSTRIDLGAVVI